MFIYALEEFLIVYIYLESSFILYLSLVYLYSFSYDLLVKINNKIHISAPTSFPRKKKKNNRKIFLTKKNKIL